MANRRSVLVARLLWIFPAILLFLTVDQLLVAFDLRSTMSDGRAVTAEVIELQTTDRADITMASIRLRVPLETGVEERELALPITFTSALEGKEEVEVRIRSGSDQEVVIAEIVRAQWRLAAINSGMSLIALILVTVGVIGWNRYLARKGDPADRPVERAV